MKILGLGGSPKKGGFTDILLDKALEGAAASGAGTEKIVINSLNIKPCQDCGDCAKKCACRIDDDMDLVRKKFLEADGLVISSPIYFGSISAQLKTLIDRFQPEWVSKYVMKNKPARETRQRGIFLCVAGQEKEEYFLNAKQIVKILFTTLDIEYSGELFFGGYNKRSGDEKEKGIALKKAFELGESLAAI